MHRSSTTTTVGLSRIRRSKHFVKIWHLYIYVILNYLAHVDLNYNFYRDRRCGASELFITWPRDRSFITLGTYTSLVLESHQITILYLLPSVTDYHRTLDLGRPTYFRTPSVWKFTTYYRVFGCGSKSWETLPQRHDNFGF